NAEYGEDTALHRCGHAGDAIGHRNSRAEEFGPLLECTLHWGFPLDGSRRCFFFGRRKSATTPERHAHEEGAVGRNPHSSLELCTRHTTSRRKDSGHVATPRRSAPRSILMRLLSDLN